MRKGWAAFILLQLNLKSWLLAIPNLNSNTSLLRFYEEGRTLLLCRHCIIYAGIVFLIEP